jgi:hypothetical protein
MSSNKRRLLLLVLPLALLHISRAQAPTGTEPITCPTSLSVTESPTAPAGWLADPATNNHPLQRISVFQKSSAGEIFDLAPDLTARQATTIRQQWTVPHDPALRTYLRCRYRNTEATLSFALAPEIKACTLKFMAGLHGVVTKPLDIHCK